MFSDLSYTKLHYFKVSTLVDFFIVYNSELFTFKIHIIIYV